MNTGFLCPVCFHFYATIDPKWPTCPDCGSEAMDVDVVPLDQFLQEHTLENLQDTREKWAAVQGFRETYKQKKLERIDKVISLKTASA
jgi:hypothetical protein